MDPRQETMCERDNAIVPQAINCTGARAKRSPTDMRRVPRTEVDPGNWTGSYSNGSNAGRRRMDALKRASYALFNQIMAAS